MIALFSIKPEYVDKIFSGTKGYEYRKAIFKLNVKKVVVYCTKPVGMIVGEFEVEDVLEGCPNLLWDRTRTSAGVRKEFYQEYFEGRSKGYAISIGKIKLYNKAIDPNDIFESFVPPQSFRYMNLEDYEECLTIQSN